MKLTSPLSLVLLPTAALAGSAANCVESESTPQAECSSSSVYASCPSYNFDWKSSNSNYPSSSIKITDVQWVSSDVYKVTISCDLSESLPLEALAELKIIGLSSPESATQILYSTNSDVSLISNPGSWSATVLVNGDSSSGSVCMPNFQIQYDWCSDAAADCADCDNWSYAKSFDLSTGCNDVDNNGNSQTDASSYCWPVECAGGSSSSVFESSSTIVSTASSVAPVVSSSVVSSSIVSSVVSSSSSVVSSSSSVVSSSSAAASSAVITSSVVPVAPSSVPVYSSFANSSLSVAPVLSTSTDVVSDIQTTLITITSCANNACATSVATTGVTVITTTVDEVETSFTTYCPLTAHEHSSIPISIPSPVISVPSIEFSATANFTLPVVSIPTPVLSVPAIEFHTSSFPVLSVPTPIFSTPSIGFSASANLTVPVITAPVFSASVAAVASTVTAVPTSIFSIPKNQFSIPPIHFPSVVNVSVAVPTTVLTFTSCAQGKCATSVATTGVTVITTTVDDVETEYTTYCPLTAHEHSSVAVSAAASQSAPAFTYSSVANVSVAVPTTVLTFTSCAQGKCATSVATTGVTVITTTVDDVETEYTTYCPLTAHEHSSVPAEATPVVSSIVATTSAPASPYYPTVTGSVQAASYVNSSVAAVQYLNSTVAPLFTNSSTASFSNSSIGATVLYSNATVSSTAVVGTTLLTLTACTEGKCSTSVATTGVTIITTTVDDVETLYTTYCPLSGKENASSAPLSTAVSETPASATVAASASASVSAPSSSAVSIAPISTSVSEASSSAAASTTLVTLSSCSEGSCSTYVATTGVTVISTTINNVETSVTTYCPLTNSNATSEAITTGIAVTSAAVNEYTSLVSSSSVKPAYYPYTNATTIVPSSVASPVAPYGNSTIAAASSSSTAVPVLSAPYGNSTIASSTVSPTKPSTSIGYQSASAPASFVSIASSLVTTPASKPTGSAVNATAPYAGITPLYANSASGKVLDGKFIVALGCMALSFFML